MISKGRPLPPVYFFLSILVMVWAHKFYPIANPIQPPFTYLGAIVILIALGWVGWAAVHFRRLGTTLIPFQEPRALVTRGPYRFSRNPMYLGLVSLLIGIATLFGTLSPFLVIPTFVLLIQEKFIKVEEAMLEKAFGEEYREFCRRVRRWI